MRHSLLLTASFYSILLVSTELAGQTGLVFYDHRPEPRPGAIRGEDRMSYIPPRSALNSERPGKPPMLEVERGAEVCFEVRNANPLLYTYTIAKRAITVEQPSGLSDLITGFGTIITSHGRARVAAGADGELQQYADDVRGLTGLVRQMNEIKLASDALAAIDYGTAFELYREAQAQNQTAERRFEANKDDPDFQLIRSLHTTTWGQIEALHREFRSAQVIGNPRVCTPVQSERLNVSLLATRKHTPKEGELTRPVDTLASITADPVHGDNFEILPAGMFSFASSGAKEFSLSGGNLQSVDDEAAHFSPGVFAMTRLGPYASPVWATVGLGKGQTAYPDLFLGLTLRGGRSLVGTNVVVGGGFTLSYVPVRVNDKAAIGQPIPSDIKLEDVVERSYRPGAGIMFTISGLEIGG
jgi:hypothetical protein